MLDPIMAWLYASQLGEKSRDIAALWVQSRGMLLLNPRPNGKLARAIGPRSPRTIQLMEKNDTTPPRFLHLCLSHLIFPLDSLSRRFNAGPIGHIHSHDAGVFTLLSLSMKIVVTTIKNVETESRPGSTEATVSNLALLSIHTDVNQHSSLGGTEGFEPRPNIESDGRRAPLFKDVLRRLVFGNQGGKGKL